MNSTVFLSSAPSGADDLSALAWVQDEVRRSLEAANKALNRYLKEAQELGPSDVDVVEPAVLRGARIHLHQAAGALEIVGLPVPSQVLRAAEGAVQRMMGKPELVTAESVGAVERAAFAVLDFIGRLVAGKPVAGVALFPQYRAVQQLAGADRIHPADLWVRDWRWREIPAVGAVSPRAMDATAREAMERLMLRLMRKPDRASLRQMGDLCADLGAGSQGRLATLWRLAAGFFEAQAEGLLRPDVFVKRATPRLLTQARAGARPDDVSERLAQDLLFFCARAEQPTDEQPAPRLAAVRTAFGLDGAAPMPDYEAAHLGRHDPAWITQARKRVSASREAWSTVAGGDLHRLGALGETFALVGDSLRRLYPDGERLAQALAAAAQQTVQKAEAPAATLAMEVATAVLYLEASLEDGELDHPELARRITRLAQRIDEVRGGADAQPLEPWMEELYRRVSDRQTMGSVVQELRQSLSEVEKQIDPYFRDPSQRELLIPVAGHLSAMRGVLSVLGLDQASQAVLRMRDDVDALAQTEVDPVQAAGAGTFERLADSLGALSFLIDMLGVQPQLVKSLFRYDAASGRLHAVMGQAGTPAIATPDFGPSIHDAGPMGLTDRAQALADNARSSEVSDDTLAGQLDNLAQQALIAEERRLAEAAQAARAALTRAEAGSPERRSLRETLAQAMQRVAASQPFDEEPPRFTPSPAVVAVPAPAPAPRAAAAAPGADDEMREVFIEEAREVVRDARAALAHLADPAHEAPDGLAEMTSVRRAFHTLKGSSRMVGLAGFGDAAWACEQLYNARLAQSTKLDAPLRTLTHQALDHFADWIEAIAAGRDGDFGPSAIVAAADALRQQGRLQAVAPAAAPVAPLAEVLPDLPAPFELDLGTPAMAPPPAAEREPLQPEVDAFALDFGALAAAPTPAPAAEPPPLPDWEPEPADTGMAATLPMLPPLAEAPPAAAAEAIPAIETIELDLSDFDAAVAAMPGADAVPEPMSESPAPAGAQATLPDLPVLAEPEPEPEQVKVIGPLRIDIAMFNIYLNEADELSRRLSTELAEWATAAAGPPDEVTVVLAHSLAGSSATVGFAELSALARALEHALQRSVAVPRFAPDEAALFNETADEIRRLLHQFAAGFLKGPAPGLVERLEHHEPAPVAEMFPATAEAEEPLVPPATGVAVEPPIEVVDAVDPELLPIFAEEGEDLVPQLQSRLREWIARPADAGAAAACLRTLHTFKGGARLAGALRVGEMAHRLEAAIERLLAQAAPVQPAEVEPLLGHADAIEVAFDALRRTLGGAPVAAAAAPVAAAEPGPSVETAIEPAAVDVAIEPAADETALEPAGVDLALEPVAAEAPGEGPAAEVPADAPMDMPIEAPTEAPIEPAAPEPAPGGVLGDPARIDWSRFAGARRVAAAEAASASAASGTVRVRAPLLDRLVGHAGEVSIARARIETDVGQIKGSLADLSENLERMRRQLRDIEVQAESQISSRMEAARAAALDFDPLEMDRYTRFQELTRMMAESVNDVATVQRGLQRSLQAAEDELAAQARLTRSLQDDLLRTRMVEFDTLADRLHRVVRQAARETGKQVRLDITGGSIEVDRGVLDRMVAPFEHLLRNAVAHGIETPDARTAVGKEATGAIEITLHQEGNEVAIELRDDGAGLDLARIRERALALGLVDAQAQPTESELADCIFRPGFSTALAVTELAGRGIGMDVVRSEVVAMGGRIQTVTHRGQGTAFRLLLPLTTAVTQVVLLRCGDVHVAVPSTLVEVVRRVQAEEIEEAYRAESWRFGEAILPFYWLGALLEGAARGAASGRGVPLVVIRSAEQRVALHVDEVVGNQEVVVKNLGPQLARLPGLAGMTLLPSGAVAPIYNPVALATLHGAQAHERLRAGAGAMAAMPEPVAAEPLAPLVLVVDDSLTVRRVTQRLLQREGYRVVTAKDGLDAIERVEQETPTVVLSDIEMPRMDGFDFVRNLRADPRFAALPVIMITSRIAQKHRDYAHELGVEHYLGKPYGEDELLALVARYARPLAALTTA